MKGPWLRLNRKTYSLALLKSGQLPRHPRAFEREVLEFCRDWLREKKTFSFRTSGSTGKPKRITFRRRQLEASAKATIKALKLKRGHTALLCLDPRFVAGRMMLVRSLIAGLNVVAIKPAANPLKGMKDMTLQFAALVPYQLKTILRSSAARKKLGTLRAVLVGGAETDAATRTRLSSITAPIYATYGMTETISHIALQKLNGPEATDYFRTLPGVTVQKDKRGCLTIRVGYLGRKKIITNDLVNALSQYKFQWLGRWDNIINTGGIKLIPERIEKKIQAFGLKHRFFVAGLPDPALGNKVVLLVEGKLSALLRKDLLAKLRRLLPNYEAPREIICLSAFAETRTQKINRTETLKRLT